MADEMKSKLANSEKHLEKLKSQLAGQNSQLKRGLEQLDENRSSLITQSEKLREQLDDAYNRLNQVKAIIIQSRLFNHAL